MSDLLPARADVVVVGGGLVGLELAKELDLRDVRDVLVLEAGPGDDLRHVNAANSADEAMRLWLEPERDRYFWRPWTSLSAPHYEGVAGLRKRLGGRSLYWQGVTLPLEPWALRAPWWPEQIVHDLTRSWQGGASLYDRVQADLAVWRAEGATSDPLRPLRIGRYELEETPQATRGSAENWEAYSPLSHWAEGLDARSTVIRMGVDVLSVVVTDGRVTGVLVCDPSGETREIECVTVVLAAGAVENARLATQAMHAAGVTAHKELDGLVDHLAQGFFVPFDPAVLPARLIELADRDSFFHSVGDSTTRTNLFLRLYRNLKDSVVLDVWTMGEQLPGSDNAVMCRPRESSRWSVSIRAGLSEADLEVVAAQRAELQSLWDAFCGEVGITTSVIEFPHFESCERILEEVLPSLADAAPDGRPVSWTRPLGTEYHEASTLPLGTRLTAEHELIGVSNLYAAGPATFPRPGAANPSLTSFALARRLAAHLARRTTAVKEHGS
ncbi:hypothetical protein ABT294_13565 [Nonomuraea sp. NPDC000554]|uniref:hypothetical protein n=1 Tax=Nonomuraea sp. NPDC000554 TaxID=3154259 RepID=UPI00332C8856